MNIMTNLTDAITASRVWRSFFRHGWPDNPLDRSLVMTTNIFFHLHPVKVSRRSLRIRYSLGLGLISTILFLILTGTGVLLMFFYTPSVERAYGDILALQTQLPLGQLMRNIHRWAAHLMVIAVVLHMVRVFYTGAYKPPREFNWIVGVLLLLLTLGASFTGYLLPWDQLAYWAITVGANIAGYTPVIGNALKGALIGGVEVGHPALIRFYVLHIMVIPGLMILLISLHLWRVRKDGGLAANELPVDSGQGDQPLPEPQQETAVKKQTATEIFPKDRRKTYGLMALVRGGSRMVDHGPDDTVFAFPVVAIIETVLFLGTLLVVLLFSLARDAPLEEIANPMLTTNPAKAPWYFVGLQEMLEHMHPTLAGIIFPLLLVLFLIVLPYLDRARDNIGFWFTSTRGKRIAILTTMYTLIVVPLYIALDNLIDPREMWREALPPLVLQIVLPVLILGVVIVIPLLILRRWQPTVREVMIVLFTGLFVSAVVFTVSGFLFRGPGFELYWPWQMPDGYNPWDSL